jgi:hypothetical protein
MSRRIRVTGVPRKKPQVGLYVLALIELARQQQARAKAAREAQAGQAKGGAR